MLHNNNEKVLLIKIIKGEKGKKILFSSVFEFVLIMIINVETTDESGKAEAARCALIVCSYRVLFFV